MVRKLAIMFNSFVIKDMLMKTNMRCHSTPRLAKIKKSNITKHW